MHLGFEVIQLWNILLHISVLLVLTSTVQAHYYPRDIEWSYILFVQQWPQSSCLQFESEVNYTKKCNLASNVTTWTVHGLWPQKDSGEIAFCNKSLKFNEAEIVGIESSLLKFWPSFFKNNSKEFWKHEWAKHGTCAAEDNLLGSVKDYFQKGLDLIQQYNMLNILATAGITPNMSSTYRLSDIKAGIQSVLGMDAKVGCVYIKDKKGHYLNQMEICFDKQLKLIPCNAKGSSCPDDGILYQPIQYPGRKVTYYTKNKKH